MAAKDGALINSDSEAPRSRPALYGGIPIGICYAASMGVCGNVLVGIGDALVEIADKCGLDAKDTGTYFLTRGVGQVLATLYCAEMYSTYHGNGILCCCLLAVTALWLAAGTISDPYMLYAWFFCTGLLTAMTDIGTQILTRRAYGSKAGPWLTCNTFMFATAGLLAPLVDYATDTLYQQCCVYGTLSFAAAFLMVFAGEDFYIFPTKRVQSEPSNDTCGEKMKKSLCGWFEPQYHNDAVMALMIFWTIGGQNMMSNYLEHFILETGVVKVHWDSGILSFFWGTMVFSRLVAMLKLQPGLETGPLITQLTIMLTMCFLSSIPLFYTPNLFGTGPTGSDGACWQTPHSREHGKYYWMCGEAAGPQNKDEWINKTETQLEAMDHSGLLGQPSAHSIWQIIVAYMVYGLFCGPILGYIFDLHNRVTISKERGSAILILGMNLGTSIVPSLYTFTFKAGLDALAMPTVLVITVLCTAILLKMLTIMAMEKIVSRPQAKEVTKNDMMLESFDAASEL